MKMSVGMLDHYNVSTRKLDETKSTDGGPQVVAANLVGDTVLVPRCKDQTTEAEYNYLGYKSVDV